MLGRWRHEPRSQPQQVFVDNGRSRHEAMSQLRRDLTRVMKKLGGAAPGEGLRYANRNGERLVVFPGGRQ